MGHKHSKGKKGKGGEENKTGSEIFRNIQLNSEIGQALKNVPLLSHLSSNERAKLGGALEEKTFAAGSVVFQEGDKCDKDCAFYIIKSGEAEVEQTAQVVCVLQAGDYFGEQSLLHGSDRNATIRAAAGGLQCWLLTKHRFEALFNEERINVGFLEREKVVLERRRMAVTAEAVNATKEESAKLAMLTEVEMSPDIKALILKAVNSSLLFEALDATHKDKVASSMESQTFADGACLIKEGEEGHTFFVLEEGSVDVYQYSADEEQDVKVDQKGVGDCFGDLALMYDAPRNATVKANGNVKCRVLSRASFKFIRRMQHETVLNMRLAFLSRIELLAKLSTYERTCLAEALEPSRAVKGEVLFKEGDSGANMYLIESGKVVFSAMKNGVDTPIDGQFGSASAGAYFGERALLDNAPRKATVTCAQDCNFLIIDRSLFEDLLGPLEKIMKKKATEYPDNAEQKEPEWKRADVDFKDLVQKGVLGRGSFGWVTLVEHTKTGTQYALKAVSKQRIVETQQQAHIFNEKNLLAKMDSPFLIKLHSTFNDKNMLYFLLEPSLGGELFRILRAVKAFPPYQAKFYAACVILGFQSLHSKNLIYRDLKPENLLVGADGYVKITDFGFCKEVPHKTHTMCGTPEYLAPEIVTAHGHGKPVDWWCVGILIYEMLVSHTPFYRSGEDQMDMYRRIVSGNVRYPSHLTPEAKLLISSLLELQPSRRMGSSQAGAEDIKKQPWFAGFDWKALEAKELKAPFTPSAKEIKKLSNFASSSEPMRIKPYVDDGSGWDKGF